ncbi:MAG: hypothetical protein ACM3XM_13820 [Mycobacterium leprae]
MDHVASIGRFLRDNPNLLGTMVTVLGGIITTMISAYVSIKLAQKHPRRHPERK